MRRAVLAIAILGVTAAGCGRSDPWGRTLSSPSATPPRPVSRVDALELWAAPPAAVNWDEVPGPDGVQVRLYLFLLRRPEPVLVDGTVEFRMYTGRARQEGEPAPEPMKTWRFTGQELDQRRFRSMVGWGYAARLGWGRNVPDEPVVTVRARYEAPTGESVESAPVSIALPKRSGTGPRRTVLGGAEDETREKMSVVAGPPLAFAHRRIDPDPPGAQYVLVLPADLNADGRPDVITGCKRGPHHLFWYENPSWKRHVLGEVPNLAPGGALADLNGDGRVDLLAGQDAGDKKLFWFEQPEDPAQPWRRRVIDSRGEAVGGSPAVGDVDTDGKGEVVVASPAAGALVYYDVPADPAVEPWPEDARHRMAADVEDAGDPLVADLDGDGAAEVLVGTTVYKRSADGKGWVGKPLAKGYRSPRLAVADLDGDNRLEIILAEGESQAGRVVWFKPPAWSPHPLGNNLFHPRSLAVADVDGDRRPDILVAEMGLGRHKVPRIIIYRNRGSGRFLETVISRGVPVHGAKVVDLTGDGRPDIIGTPYAPQRHVDLWVNQTQ